MTFDLDPGLELGFDLDLDQGLSLGELEGQIDATSRFLVCTGRSKLRLKNSLTITVLPNAKFERSYLAVST